MSKMKSKHPFPDIHSPSSRGRRVESPIDDLANRMTMTKDSDDEGSNLGPLRTIVYVPNKKKTQGRFPVVSVHKRYDGRYVVLEQRPIHTHLSHYVHPALEKLEKKEKELNEQNIKFNSLKPAWKWSSQGKSIDRSFDRGYYQPHLPPISSQVDTESRIGSLDNVKHKPKGGKKKIPHFKVHWEADAKVGSLDNVDYNRRKAWRSYPGSERTSAKSEFNETGSLKLPDIRPRYGASAFNGGAFGTVHFIPGDLKRYKKPNNAKSKVGSLDNFHHKPGGGSVEIAHYPIDIKAEAKIDSLEKIFHEPQGGDVQIINLNPKWKAESKIGSLENADHKPKKSGFKVPHFKENFKEVAKPRVGSLDNISHTPRGGNKEIYSSKLNWKKESKISEMWKTKFEYVDPNDLDYDEDAEIEARIRELMNR